MSGTTEIYICKPGQEIRQGKLETSDTVTSRAAAMADATLRTKADSSIAVIAYYAVDDNGQVEDLYTFGASPEAKSSPRSAPSGAKASIAKGGRKKGAPKKSFFGKLRAVFEA
ncbi:MAG: hypothetical protein HOM58_15995 [Rhodospirillaceae bacterium]|jgi:hypothetical protein|nr:hypothetical protein [Rhodospirillaceae bacterium]MBT5459537.1 hypothetical protein [Rhodospirillaceae bacterium]